MNRKGRGFKGVVKEVIEYGQSLGFVMNVTPGGHIKFAQPGCQPVFVSQTPSDGRAGKNAKGDLRRSASASSVNKSG